MNLNSYLCSEFWHFAGLPETTVCIVTRVKMLRFGVLHMVSNCGVTKR